MGEFMISPARTKQNSAEIGNISSRIASLERRVSSANSAIRWVPSLMAVSPALSKVQNSMNSEAGSMRNMQSALESCVNFYERAERNSCGKGPIGIISDIIIPGIKPPIINWDARKVIEDWLKSRNPDPGWIIKGGLPVIGPVSTLDVLLGLPGLMEKWDMKGWKGGDKSNLYKLEPGDIIERKGKDGKITQETNGKDKSVKKMLKDGKWVDDDDSVKYAKKKGTLLEKEWEAKAEGKLWGASAGDEKIGADIAVGKAEAHAKANAGIYGYDKDGNLVFAPAVGAEIGASVCVLTASARANVGNEDLGAGVNGEVSAGKAEAKAEVKAAMFGKDGKLSPEVKASASAEAIAAEAKASGHVSVGGVTGTVNGSVNFGVGAHADIGITGGKIKCDIGASLGVGASVGFEVDVSGAVKHVASAAKSVWNGVKKLKIW